MFILSVLRTLGFRLYDQKDNSLLDKFVSILLTFKDNEEILIYVLLLSYGN